ncbi:hypothetical protein QUF54_06930 [Candidatus Marithioploca araucensis]|uniref:Uncharacterized protein n=1 Tax=Candidatus Marithioploca araucensis TaxID=70273 RepID=A0ABT7VU10_9GAMM|nr:hypothetical protein [Candidatus Marithioploca araucensis]
MTGTDNSLKTVTEPISEEESLLSMVANPFIENRLMTQFQHQLTSWLIYHDISVDRNAPLRQPVVTRAERRVDPDGQNWNGEWLMVSRFEFFSKNSNLEWLMKKK